MFRQNQKILPRRSVKTGVRPGDTAPTNKEDNWTFPTLMYTEQLQKMIVASMVQVGVLCMMNTHIYEFNGLLYLQQEGGPLGLGTTHML